MKLMIARAHIHLYSSSQCVHMCVSYPTTTTTITDFCINTLDGAYSVVREYGFGRFGVPKCKVECRYILEDGCAFRRRRFPFFHFVTDPSPGFGEPCIEEIFSFASGDLNCEIVRD